MIDLTQSLTASPFVQTVAMDPGSRWLKDARVAIDAPPDNDVDPLPEARWSADLLRTGVCGAVSPRVIRLPSGQYRMYYTQILPQPEFPAGANDYDHSTTRILSAISDDGSAWTPEAGVRLTPQAGGAGLFRVVSSEVVPTDAGNQLRMYYECCPGPQSVASTIRSALSLDGGLQWTPEPGARLSSDVDRFSAPRIVFLDDGRCRLYCLAVGKGIVSAISEDGGVTFVQEPGLRIAQDSIYDSHAAFAPEIMLVADVGYVMYYAGYGSPTQACILRAISDDGFTWTKDPLPVLLPGNGTWDAAKCSEMCLIRTPDHKEISPRFRMLYEACDGTSINQRGVWRIASATTPS